MKLSCIELTDPFTCRWSSRPETRAAGAEANLLALHVAAVARSSLTDGRRRHNQAGLPLPSKTIAPTTPRPDGHHDCEDCAALPAILDHVTERERERERDDHDANVSRKLLNGVEFSNGWAELTLKNPPPFVPSCLMATGSPRVPPGSLASCPRACELVCPRKF